MSDTVISATGFRGRLPIAFGFATETPPGENKKRDEIRHAEEPVQIEDNDEIHDPDGPHERKNHGREQRDPHQGSGDEFEQTLEVTVFHKDGLFFTVIFGSASYTGATNGVGWNFLASIA